MLIGGRLVCVMTDHCRVSLAIVNGDYGDCPTDEVFVVVESVFMPMCANVLKECKWSELDELIGSIFTPGTLPGPGPIK
jgi:hypothetical protein